MSVTINIRGVIGLDPEATPEHLGAELAKAGAENVLILVNSPGGFIFDGIEMANQIRRHTENVIVRITGIAASMASYIAIAADVTEVEDNAVFMIHNPFTISAGDHRDMEKTANMLESLTALLARSYAEKSGQSVGAIREAMNNASWFFGAEIFDAGFADSVVNAGEGAESKAEALQIATVAVTLCEEALKSKGEDTSKIAASLTGEPAANKLEPIKKERAMTLAEFLKENPEAQAEIDVMISAKIEVFTAALEEGRKALNSDAYSSAVKGSVLDMAMVGNLAGVTAAISVYDQILEQQKADAASKSLSEETPAEDPAKESNGVVSNMADADIAADKLRDQQGA